MICLQAHLVMIVYDGPPLVYAWKRRLKLVPAYISFLSSTFCGTKQPPHMKSNSASTFPGRLPSPCPCTRPQGSPAFPTCCSPGKCTQLRGWKYDKEAMLQVQKVARYKCYKVTGWQDAPNQDSNTIKEYVWNATPIVERLFGRPGLPPAYHTSTKAPPIPLQL